MTAARSRPTAADRAALAALCLLLAASAAAKVHAYRDGTDDPERVSGAGGPGVEGRAARGGATIRMFRVEGCRDPVTARLVDPSPHGEDALLAAPPGSGDRVFYVYRGWTLGGRFAAAELEALHLAWRTAGVLRMAGGGARRDPAVELVIPAGCDASATDAATGAATDAATGAAGALWRELRSW